MLNDKNDLPNHSLTNYLSIENYDLKMDNTIRVAMTSSKLDDAKVFSQPRYLLGIELQKSNIYQLDEE